MATRALTQACRALRVVPQPACSLRFFNSTLSCEHASAALPRAKPSGQTQKKPSGQTQKKPSGQTQKKPSDQNPRKSGQKPGGAEPAPKTPSGINPRVVEWAARYNVGFQNELKQARLRSSAAKHLHFKFSPRPVFRQSHVASYFTGFEQVLTEYRLYRYEKELAVPLWVHISAVAQVKPIVRSFARRRVREGLRQALAERGYTLEGRAVEGGKTGAGDELKGTIWVYLTDPVFSVNLDKEEHVGVGREMVSYLESHQAAARPGPRRR